MADYKFKHTDSVNGIIVVYDNTANGHQTPADPAFYVNELTGVGAVSANTSLVFIGKSLAEYGEVVQNNMIYLMEHFSNKSRPLAPTQGQIWYKNADYADPAFPTDPTLRGLYIWNDTTWEPVALTSNMVANLNMKGFRIINLGDPVDRKDAVNLDFADKRYLQLTGGTVVGPVTFNGTPVTIGNGAYLFVNESPTQPLHAANKKYVDDQDTALKDFLINMINAVIASQANYVLKAGDTMSGTLNLGADASLILTGGGTGTIEMGARRVQNIANPVGNQDATTRYYVDTTIQAAIANIPPPVIPPVGVVFAGSLDANTGVLTLQRTEGLPDIIVSGTFASKTHTQLANTVNVDTQPFYEPGFVSKKAHDGALSSPTANLQDVIRVFDQAVTELSHPRHRQLIVQTVAGQITYMLDPENAFVVDAAQLMVYKNGIKQYASERGMATARFNSPMGLIDGDLIEDGTYNFSIVVNGSTYPITIVASTLTFYEMFDQIQTAITNGNIPCTLQYELFGEGGLCLYFKSNSSGPGSSVVLNSGTFFSNMESFVGSTNRTVTTAYGYTEVGLPGAKSITVTFDVAPAVGEVLEFLVAN